MGYYTHAQQAALYYARKRRRGDGGGISASIYISGGSIDFGASVGDTVGTLSVIDGSGGAYTFTIHYDEFSLWAIDGDDLEVNAALTPGTYAVTIKGDDGAGSVVYQALSIEVTGEMVDPGDGPSLDFSDPDNSMYIPVI